MIKKVSHDWNDMDIKFNNYYSNVIAKRKENASPFLYSF